MKNPRLFKLPNGEEVECACVNYDSKECARIREGYEIDDRRYEYRIARRCECACHDECRDDEDDL